MAQAARNHGYRRAAVVNQVLGRAADEGQSGLAPMTRAHHDEIGAAAGRELGQADRGILLLEVDDLGGLRQGYGIRIRSSHTGHQQARPAGPGDLGRERKRIVAAVASVVPDDDHLEHRLTMPVGRRFAHGCFPATDT